MSNREDDVPGFTDVVFITSKTERKEWRDAEYATYVGKKDGKFYNISVTSDDNAYKGKNLKPEIFSHEITEEEYKRMLRSKK